ncbi:MAG: TIR domain-containing protein [Acidobacteriota bacterium]
MSDIKSSDSHKDIFISYSRKDKGFVQRLHDALKGQGRKIWVDWNDIPPRADWDAEIKSNVQAADSFLFVLSPNSVASPECGKELDQAIKNNKRLVPVVWLDVDPKTVKAELAKLNWVYMRETDNFDEALTKLAAALDADLEWVHAHTRLLTRAVEWNNKKRDDSLVLRGRDLREAEEWQPKAANKEPKLTQVQGEYILASRKSATNRQRIIIAGVTIALFVAVVLAIVAVLQRNTAIAERNLAQSRELASSAISELTTDTELSGLLALESAKVVRTAESENALRQWLYQSHLRAVLRSRTDGIRSTEYYPEDEITAVAYSPDGKSVVTASGDHSAKIWDAATGAVVRKLEGHTGAVNSAAYSSDGKYIVTSSRDGIARVWDSQTGAGLATLPSAPSAYPYKSSVAFSPDSQYLAAIGKENLARIWQVGTWRQIAELKGHVRELVTIKFSPDSQYVGTTSLDYTARIWDAKTGRSVSVLNGHGGYTLDIAFSPDSKLVATGSADRTARIWDVTSGKNLGVLSPHFRAVVSVDFSPDGETLLTASDDTIARGWDVSTHTNVEVMPGHTGELNGAVYSPDGNFVLTYSRDGTAGIFDTNHGTQLIVLRGHSNWITSAAFSPDGQSVVTGSKDGTARLWQLSTLVPMTALPGKFVPDDITRWSPNGKLAATTSVRKNEVKLWDMSSGSVVSTMIGRGQTKAMAFSGDSKLLAIAGEDGSTVVWDVSTGKSIATSQAGANDYHSSVALSPDGTRMVTSNKDGIVELWQVSPGQPPSKITGPWTPLKIAGDSHPAFSHDGKSIVVTTGNKVVVWKLDDLTSGARHVVEYPTDGTSVDDASFSQDDTLIFGSSGGSGVALVWNVASKTLESRLDLAQPLSGSEFAFRPDGKFVIVVGTSSNLTSSTITDVSSRNAVAALYTGAQLHYIGDGQLITDDASIYTCDACGSMDDLVKIVSSRITRPLTCQERQRYLHEEIVCPAPALAVTATSVPEGTAPSVPIVSGSPSTDSPPTVAPTLIPATTAPAIPTASGSSSASLQPIITQTAIPTPTASRVPAANGSSSADLQPMECSKESSLRSLESKTATTIQIVNATTRTLQVHWIDYAGKRQLWNSNLAASGTVTQQTFVTHPWLVTDSEGRCLAVFLPADKPARAVVK